MKFHGYYRDGAIIQRDEPMRLRGYAQTGAEVVCTLCGGGHMQEKKVVADEKGVFETEFSPVSDTLSTFVLSAESAEEKIAVNVRFGDVYLAMGQSNMSYSLGAMEDCEEWQRRAAQAKTAFLSLDEKPFTDISEVTRPVYPLNDFMLEYAWRQGDSEIVKQTSALSVQTATLLSETKKVPIGVVHTAMGGLSVEAYLRREPVETDEKLTAFLRKVGRYNSIENYNQAGGRNYSQIAGVWNEKISPLIGMKFKGIIWYLGESSAWDFEFAEYFLKEMKMLVKDTERCFGNVPFIVVQIAPEYYPYGDRYGYEYINEALILLQEGAERVVCLPTYDIEPRWLKPDGDLYYHPIHPINKAPIAERIALALRQRENGEDARYPSIISVKYETGKAVCTVAHTGKGLCVGEVCGFTLSGDNGKYYPAQAKVIGPDTIEVVSPDVRQPTKLTYAFMQYQDFCNVITKDGAPLQPYRSEYEPVNERYCFPPAYTVSGALEVYENCFGWQVGTCRKVPIWKKGELYDAAAVNIDSEDGAISVSSQPTANEYFLFGVSPAVCLSGHKNHLADYRFWNWQMKAEGETEFLGVLARMTNGEVFRFNLMNGEKKENDSLPIMQEYSTFSVLLEEGLRGDSAPIRFTAEERRSFVQIELLFRSKTKAKVYIKDIALSDLNASVVKQKEEKQEIKRADTQLLS